MTPTFYAAHPIVDGQIGRRAGDPAVYLGRCGSPGCPYWADHPTDLAQVIDAVAGHRAREHPDNAMAEPEPRPTTLLDRLGQSMAASPHYRPRRAAGEGDAAEHDVSPGVLTFGRPGAPPGYGIPGVTDRELREAPVLPHVPESRPTPRPRDRQQEPHPRGPAFEPGDGPVYPVHD